MAGLSKRQTVLAIIVLLALGSLLFFLNHDDLIFRMTGHLRDIKAQSDVLREEILSHGAYAPVFFIAVQIFQVIFAPIPGEASGLVGGYLFGTWPCFVYSSIGLSIGSAIAFGGGRLLGSFFTERFRHREIYKRFNHLVSRGDYLIPFILFIFPGFPKDSLSYLLGMSAMPFPVFMFITTVGRMPGTLLLSANGAEAYNGDYTRLAILVIFSGLIVIPPMIYRHKMLEALQRWRAKHNLPQEPETDDQ